MKTKKARASFGLLVLAFGLVLAGCSGQPAATPTPTPKPVTRDMALEHALQEQLAKIDPVAVPIYNQATQALDAGDDAAAKKLYEMVTVRAPGFSAAYRRLGYIQSKENDLSGAIALTQKAVDIEPNAYNQTALAALLLQKNTPADSQEAFKLASSAAKVLPDDDQTQLVLLMSAAAVNNGAVAHQADQHLLELTPNSSLGHYFAGLLAAKDGNPEEAESQMQTAQSLGMSPATVQQALAGGISQNAFNARMWRWTLIAVAVVLLGLGIFFIARRPRVENRRRPRPR